MATPSSHVSIVRRVIVAVLRSPRFYGVVVSLAGIFIVAYVWIWGTVKKDLAGTSWTIPGEAIREVWFSPNNDLLFVDETEGGGRYLHRYRFQGNNWELAGKIYIDVKKYAEGCGWPISAVANMPFGVSRDGQKLVVASDNSLCVIAPSGNHGSKVIVASRPHAKITSTTLVGTNGEHAVAVYDDGRLMYYNVLWARAEEAGTWLGGGWSLLSRRGVLLAASLETGEVTCLVRQVDGELLIRSADVSTRVNAVSVDAMNCSRMVVGDDAGSILFIEGESSSSGVLRKSFVAQGEVKALAFAPSGDLFAGGNFGSIYLIEDGDAPRAFLSVEPGVRMLAVGDHKLAYVGSDLVVVDIESGREFNNQGTFVGGVVGLVLSVVGFVTWALTLKRSADISKA